MLCLLQNAIKIGVTMLIFFHNMDGLYSNFVTDKVVITYLFKKQNKIELTFTPYITVVLSVHTFIYMR